MSFSLIEGKLYSVYEAEEWTALTVRTGMILVAFNFELDDYGKVTEAAFFVRQVDLRPDLSICCVVKSLGSPDEAAVVHLSRMFNRRLGYVHLCLTEVCGEGFSDTNTNCIHLTSAMFFQPDNFERAYVTAHSRRQIQKWLDDEPEEEAEGKQTEAAGKEGDWELLGTPPRDKPVFPPTPGPDRARVPALRKSTAPKDDADGSSRPGKMNEKDRQALRARLSSARERLTGAGTGMAGHQPAPPKLVHAEPELILSSDEYSPSVLDDSRMTRKIKRERVKSLPDQPMTSAGHQETHQIVPHRGNPSVVARGATKDGSSKNLQTQLMQKAAEASQLKKSQQHKEDKKKKANSPGHQLVKLLTSTLNPSQSSKGKDKKKKKKAKKEKKEPSKDPYGINKRESQVPGDPSSSSEPGDGDGGSSDDDADVSSSGDSDMLPPLRKKSKKRPGSVLQLLVNHAKEQLDQTNKVSTNRDEDITLNHGVKISSYFNIVVRPQISGSMTQVRELHHLSNTISSQTRRTRCFGRRSGIKVHVDPPIHHRRRLASCKVPRAHADGRGQRSRASGGVRSPQTCQIERQSPERRDPTLMASALEGKRKRKWLQSGLEPRSKRQRKERRWKTKRKGEELVEPDSTTRSGCRGEQEEGETLTDLDLTLASDDEFRLALAQAVQPLDTALFGQQGKISFADSLNLCTSLASIGCVLCWWVTSGTKQFGLCQRTFELFDDWISHTVAKNGSRLSCRRGVTFPLRAGDFQTLVDDFSHLTLSEVTSEHFVTTNAAKAWTWLEMMVLNRLAGYSSVPLGGRWSQTERRAVESMTAAVRRRLARDKDLGPLSETAWRKDLSGKQVSYQGEEVSVCHQLNLDQILPALPPPEHGGCIDTLNWVSPRTRKFLLNPKSLLKPVDEVVLPRMPGKAHIADPDKLLIALELIQRNVCDWIPVEEVYSINGTKVLNGLFGVKKPTCLADGRPVLRFIMNLVGSNATQFQMEGGTASLPSITSWQSIVLEDNQYLELFQSDMCSAFYLFKLPAAWKPHLSFNLIFSGEFINRTPGVKFALCCNVIPMGWISSVAIMQEISENLLRQGRLSANGQIARGKNLPIWFNDLIETSSSNGQPWWHVYLDNFCAGERVRPTHPSIHGTMCHDAAEKAWADAGVISSDKKRVASATCATELGAEIDGEERSLGLPVEKLIKLVQGSLWLVSQPLINRKHLQIYAGRWIFALQFRRPAMCLFDHLWKLSSGNHRITPQLKLQVRRELMSIIFAAPLIHCNLGASVSEVMMASDASETGGAYAVAESLSEQGNDFLNMTTRLDKEEHSEALPILLISLFNGIGGCFRAYDVCGVIPSGRIACDIDRGAMRVTTRRWPGTICIDDVRSIDEAMVKDWSRKFVRIKEIHLWAGSPCNDLSSARDGRQNLNGPASGLYFEVPRIKALLKREFSPEVIVKDALENVASMDESAAREISWHQGNLPYLLDPVGAVPMRRPRFAWLSEGLEGVFLDVTFSEGRYWKTVEACAPYPFTKQWLQKGKEWQGEEVGAVFPTAMKSLPRRSPPSKPAGLERCSSLTLKRWEEDQFRYPPYQYDWKFVISDSHSWRLLSAEEKELLLGYGFEHTKPIWSASKAKQQKQAYDDARHCSLGESFSIYSFVMVAYAFCRSYLPQIHYSHLAKRMGMAPGFAAPLRVTCELSRELKYGSGQIPTKIFNHGMSLFNRLLLRKTNHTGSDVRLTTGQLISQKVFPRQSVAAAWWIWKDVRTKRWTFKSHINVLELQMILESVRFQVERLKTADARIFHLADSYVAISVASKGRSSSQQLNRVLKHLNALLLAHGLQLVLGHVDSSENPTDEGSRK